MKSPMYRRGRRDCDFQGWVPLDAKKTPFALSDGTRKKGKNMKTNNAVLDSIIASVGSETGSANWHTDAWKGPAKD